MVRICIVGLTAWDEYGKYLADKATAAGHHVYAYDEDVAKVMSYRREPGEVKYYYDFRLVPVCSAYVIAVPADRLRDRLEAIGRDVPDPTDRLVVVESPVPIGKTRSHGGFLENLGFHLCHSPHARAGEVKLVAGATPRAAERLASLYKDMFAQVRTVGSLEVAEGARLLTGVYKATNVALVNEFSDICNKVGVNPWEVMDAAATGEPNFNNFVPWVGVGGDSAEDPLRCTRICNTPVIKAVSNHVLFRPRKMAEKLAAFASAPDDDRHGPCLVVGLGAEPYSSSWQTSPVVEFIRNISTSELYYWDPYVGPGFAEAKFIPYEEAAERHDWVAVYVFHPYVLSAWKGRDNVHFFCQTEAYV
jgi:UDP-N-acetyl-D-mannosaminuronate dehydrogenase